ncbi:hypothetical protein M9Y10_010503 [Tritrichomonas musculus]|uniref:Ankyrin repeat protein n=1 Tax=Tritrichomonas musculus TaxID=1915356 RepID=A0ABR2IMQ6_9EUKA
MSERDRLVKMVSLNDLVSLRSYLNRNVHFNVGEANFSYESETHKSFDRNARNRRNDDDQQEEDLPNTGLTLLHIAAYYNALECFRYLQLEKKLGLSRKSAGDFLPLHYACRTGSYEVALYILTSEPSQATYQVSGGGNLQLLYCATVGGDPQILEALFYGGAKMTNTAINNEKKLIEKAIGVHNREILTILLDHPAQKGKNTPEMTTAMRAVICHNPEALGIIYRKGDALVHFTDKFGYHSLISLICEMDPGKSFKKILLQILTDVAENEIEPPVKGGLMYQSGVCHWACMYYDLEVARKMFKTKGFLPNRLDNEHKTGAARLAERKGKEVIEILDLLITQHDFNINARENESYPTLLESFASAINANYEAIQFLIASGARTDVKHSKKNMTLYDFVKGGKNIKLKKAFGIK